MVVRDYAYLPDTSAYDGTNTMMMPAVTTYQPRHAVSRPRVYPVKRRSWLHALNTAYTQLIISLSLTGALLIALAVIN